MDCCLCSTKPSVVVSSLRSFPERKSRVSSLLNFSGCRRFIGVTDCHWRRTIIVSNSSAAASDWEFTSLNTPYEPKSSKGKILSTVLQNDFGHFHSAVDIQLAGLVDNRRQAVDRLNLSVGSDEECLHRRIAELQENESQISVQDIIYMLIIYKFKEMQVHLVPKLSSCICINGRLEIYPSKDWELESIHTLEVLEMVKEHLTVVIGWKENATLTDNWATKQIYTRHLFRIYAASILFGYFLKSASLRRDLELCLAVANKNLGLATIGQVSRKPTSLGQYSFTRGKKIETLKGYVTRFDSKTLQMHAKPKTKETAKLIEKHSSALFGTDIEEIDVISTSMSTLKRLVLEAVAFGSFLWDAEEYVNGIYKLEEN